MPTKNLSHLDHNARLHARPILVPWLVLGLVTFLVGCPEEGTVLEEPTAVNATTPRPRSSPIETASPGGSVVDGTVSGTLPTLTPAPTPTAVTPTPEPTWAPITRPGDAGNALPSSSPQPLPSMFVPQTF
jgi:hypothetical protein